MITRKEEEKIQILSDTELYPQAIKLMRSIGRSLPPTQINGLLNVSLSNTYADITYFVNFQHTRSTWEASKRHIPDFYRKLAQELKTLEKRALTLLSSREEVVTEEDQEDIILAFVREFIQHLLAENYYMAATRAFQSAESSGAQPGKSEQQRYERRKP